MSPVVACKYKAAKRVAWSRLQGNFPVNTSCAALFYHVNKEEKGDIERWKRGGSGGSGEMEGMGGMRFIPVLVRVELVLGAAGSPYLKYNQTFTLPLPLYSPSPLCFSFEIVYDTWPIRSDYLSAEVQRGLLFVDHMRIV